MSGMGFALRHERAIAGLSLGALLLLLGFAIAAPLFMLLSKSFYTAQGAFIGFGHYWRYFATPSLVASLINSLSIGATVTLVVIPLAFFYAYALTRSAMPLKGLFLALAMLPLFAPSLLPALSMIYLFGNQGLLKILLGGLSIYGPLGIVLSQTVYCFPHALLILMASLSLTDGRLYEAAAAMGTSRWRVFTTITLPGIRYGLISAAFVVFTLSMTDFGIAKVIGGHFGVLATDAYKQVIGQQNFEMGAVVGMVLLIPALIAFGIDRLARRRQAALVSGRARFSTPRGNVLRDRTLFAYCLLLGSALVGLLGVAVWASFIRYWPYNLSLTLNNYAFSGLDGGWSVYWNSLLMAAGASLIGTAVIFAGAYLIEKTRAPSVLRALAHFIAMLPMAVPGLVLGLGTLFFINAPWNPLGFLYGGLAILTINCIAHFYTVAHIACVSALKLIDPEFEAVAMAAKVPFWRHAWRVTLPICLPTVLEVALYLFVNALTTVSAVIFLYAAHSKLAAIAVVHLDEGGLIAPAAAMASCLLMTALLAKALQFGLGLLLERKLQGWRKG
jgi:iron(III) transport system permease protein